MSGRKVIIKMRNLKKRFANNEMLYLAIILSLLRTDPDSFMSGLGSSSNTSGGGNDLHDSGDQPFGDMWIQTQSHQDSFGFGLGGNDLSPRLHPKNYESMLERFHSEILDDLNNLGRYDRIRPCYGQPVEINAYVLNADQDHPDRNDGNNPNHPDPRSSSPNHGESDHDSGISDTEAQMSSPSDSEDLEEVFNDPAIEEATVENRDDSDPGGISRVSPLILEQDGTLELDLGFAANPFDVLGAPDVSHSGDFIPDEEDVVNQLIHIDDQLNYIDENLDEISDEFLHLDEQLAVHLQEEQVVTGSDGSGGSSDNSGVGLDDDLLLTEVDFAAQPFDDWLLDADRSLEEFAHLSDDVFIEAQNEKIPEPKGDDKASQALKTASQASATSSFKPNGDQKTEFPPATNGFLSSAGSSLESSPRSRNNSAPLTTASGPNASGPNASAHPIPSNTQTVASPRGPNNEPSVPSLSNDPPSAATPWAGDGKFEQSSLEDLLRTSHPEGLLRNVSLNQGFSQAHTLNDSFPLPGSGDQSSNSDLAFGASNLANLTSTANTQTTAEGQSAGEAPFGITDTEIIKEIFNVFGGRDLHEVENWAPIDGSSTSFSSAKSGNSSSLSTNNGRQQHRNDLSASSSTTAQGSIRHESLGEDPYCNGSVTPTFDNGSMTPSPYAAAMLSAATIPGYSGYNPYLAAATGRYPPTAATPYTPLMNHSYAAVAAAASLTPSQSTTLGASSSSGAMALDDLDSASHTSGKSSMSKDFSFDPSSIKQEPEEFSSSSCGSGIGRSRQCRDEKKARELGVTFSIDDIINLPMDEFNDMLSRQELTEEQLNLCRDIRRRGKNKVAAQNCRKRKIDQIAQLEEEVHRARTRKQNLLMERETLFRQRDEWRSKLMGVEEDILSEMGRNTKEFRLDFGAPDVRILRRDELMVGRQSSAVDHLETNRYAQTGPNSSADTSQHPNFNWKSDSNQHS